MVTAKNVKSGYIDYTIDDYISEEEFKERQQRGISKKGDILFTTEAPLGNAALADMEKFSAGQRLITFQQYGPKNELINYVMLMFILSDFFQQQLYVNKTGSTVAGIKATILKTLWIPVPPYNEQLRISNTLKSAINLIDSISQNKEILSTSISNTKSKILDLAIRGKLVPQDPNDEPASVLLERIRAEKEELIKQGKIKRDKKESVIFKGDDNSYYEKIDGEVSCIDEEIPYDIPDTWTWMRLENCCVKEIRRGKSPKYAEISNVIVFAQKCNTKYNGIDISLAQYLDETTIKRYPTDEHMQDGDIVINSTGIGTLGRVGIYRNTDNTTGLLIVPDSHVTVIRSFSCISSHYLYAFMKAHQTELEKKSEGSTNQKELKPLTLKEMLIAVPPLSEQKRIDKSINVAFSHLSYNRKVPQLRLFSICSIAEKVTLSLLQIFSCSLIGGIGITKLRISSRDIPGISPLAACLIFVIEYSMHNARKINIKAIDIANSHNLTCNVSFPKVIMCDFADSSFASQK